MTQDTNTASGAADRAIEDCPELNMGNYDEVDVERLNDWAIRAHDEIDRLHALAAGQATAAQAQPVAESAEVSAVESNTAVARMQPRKIDECYGDCPTNPATCPNPCKFLGRTTASHGQAPTGTTEPTEQQILEAAEKAGLWPNTVHSWIPAFHRYHKELAKAQPAPAQAAPAAVAAPADSVLEDAAFEAVRKKLCALPRYSFVLDDDGLIRRVQDRTGNWIEFDDAHELFDPVAVDTARKQGASQ